MERKAALIQLSKFLPKDYYSKKAIGMDNMIAGGAYVSLGENNEVKLIEGTPVTPTRFRNIYGMFGQKPDNQEPPIME